MNDSSAGLPASADASLYGQVAAISVDGTTPSPKGDGLMRSQPGIGSDTSAPTAAFQDQFHEYMQGKFGTATTTGDTGSKDSVLIADSSSGSPVGGILNYAGYITYIGLATSAFGHDDPFQLQTKAMRFFQETILHHHAIDNPQTWVAMGDAVMTEQHLAGQGAKFKPIKFATLNKEVKHETAEQNKQDHEVEHDGEKANAIMKDVTNKLKSPADYVLAAKFLYTEAVHKADERAKKESVDHKGEKRLLGRLKLLSGETDFTDALGSRDNSVDPVLDELGSRVSYRLEAAALMERYGSKVPELGWTQEAADMRAEARKIYEDPTALSEPVRTRLHQKYGDALTDKPDVIPPSVSKPA